MQFFGGKMRCSCVQTNQYRRVRSSYCTIGNADSPGPGVIPTGQLHLKRPVPASPTILSSPGPGVIPTGQLHLKRPVPASPFFSNATWRMQHPARPCREIGTPGRLKEAFPGSAPSRYPDQIRILEYHEILPYPPDRAFKSG